MIIVNKCNYLLRSNTNGLVSNYFIIHWNHDVEKIWKFVEFIVDIHNLLKFFFLFLPSEQTNLNKGSFWVVQLVSKQCYTHPSVWASHNVNHFVNRLQLLLHVLGQCRLKNWRQILICEKIVCCNNYLFSLSNKLVEISFSHWNVLSQSKFCIFVFSLEHFQLSIQIVGVIFGPGKSSKSVLTFDKVHLVGKS